MKFHIEYPRILPERRPEGHEPGAPRYTLRWRKPVNRIISAYYGIQGSPLSENEQKSFFDRFARFFESNCGPETYETMRCIDEEGYTNAIIVAYWTDQNQYTEWEQCSDFADWWESTERLQESFGYWREIIAIHYDRHETIYSASDYRIGLALCSDSELVPMNTNGYFGAARDRLPISSVDSLPGFMSVIEHPSGRIDTHNRRLFAETPHNMTAIRSGQYWAEADSAQSEDYQLSMQPKLMDGMRYLLENRKETGTLSLRIMTNLDRHGRERDETSVYACFVDMAGMEEWASSHTSHLRIYNHAIEKKRQYGENRSVVTWHEVFILTSGLPFEYINCHPGTGLLPFCTLYERL
ncbi:phenylacetaldoxime dehydratase family protein [Kushneria aurantia]|uniref:Phenylacetaldoxime dehydratase family protein n=1 Tax=Kushneria aurantia TaxID=504092 RepID=A0ABV6G2R9_9GAMM|nr:phenylacetaldoxime dehydratase family protein [Kushneria aurantia]